MNGTARSAVVAALAMLGPAPAASAQAAGAGTTPGPSSVTLEQLTPARGRAAASAAELDIPQPPRPAGEAAVTSSEVSARADGRAVAMGVVDGADRCATSAGAADPVCRHRLETRAGQFARPSAAPITPDARLLLLTPNADERGAIGSGTATGPAEQLAGALRDQSADRDAAATAATAKSAEASALPAGVPTVAVLPR